MTDKKLRLEVMREKARAWLNRPSNLVKPTRPPRYDDVFFEWTAMMNDDDRLDALTRKKGPDMPDNEADKAFDKAIKKAYKARNEALKAFERAYLEALDKADKAHRKALDEASRKANKAYRKARAEAYEAYRKATDKVST